MIYRNCTWLVVAVLGVAIGAPAAAVTSYRNSADAYDKQGVVSKEILVSTTDGSVAVATNSGGDGYAGASASMLNNGTATASASSIYTPVDAIGATTFSTSFDFSPSTTGRVTLRLSGWAIGSGSGYASVESYIILTHAGSGQLFQSPLVYSGNGYASPDVSGLRKLSFVKTINWAGGDTLKVNSQAYASAGGDGRGGTASAYVDPVVTLTPGGVPEPAVWLSMVAGFGAVGTSLRRRPAVA